MALYVAGIDGPAGEQILAYDPRFIVIPLEVKGDNTDAFFDSLVLDGGVTSGG